MEDEEGVVIMESGYMDALPERKRLELQNSVEPVVIPIGEEAESEDLRNKIKQAIGVDSREQRGREWNLNELQAEGHSLPREGCSNNFPPESCGPPLKLLKMFARKVRL